MGILDFFGGSNTSNKGAFDQFADEMGRNANRYNPFIDAGNRARDISFDQYNRLINDPNAVQDQIAKGFYESPYQKYMQDQVAKRMDYNSANTGMLGSGAANRALADELTKMTGRFEDDYINRGLNSYGQGLQGMGGLTDLGFKAMNSQDNLLEQAAAGRLKGEMSENEAQQANGNAFGNLLGTGLGIAGSIFGGPAGGAIGSGIGKFFSSGGPSQATAQPGGSFGAQFPMAFGNAGSTFNLGNWSF